MWRARGRFDCETTPSVSPANRQVIDTLPSSLSFFTKYKVLSSQSSSKETHSAAVWPFPFHRSSLAAWQRHIQSQSNRASLRLIHHGTNTASSSRTVCSYLAYTTSPPLTGTLLSNSQYEKASSVFTICPSLYSPNGLNWWKRPPSEHLTLNLRPKLLIPQGKQNQAPSVIIKQLWAFLQ